MAEQTSNLEERLTESGRTWRANAGGPAPAFLAAVRRRRTARRARAAGYGALVVLAVAGSVWLARVGPRPSDPQDHPEVAGSKNGKEDNTLSPAPKAPTLMPTVAQLTSLNRGTSIENTKLPETDVRRSTERPMRPMRLMDSRNPEVFEAAFSGL